MSRRPKRATQHKTAERQTAERQTVDRQTVDRPLADRRRAAEAFVAKLGRALHRYGSPAHRLEEAMLSLSARLGLTGQFFSTPTAMFASFGDGTAQRTVLLRVEPGDVDLEKLSRLDAVLTRVLHGSLTPRRASEQVDVIVAAPTRYGPVLSTLAFALASASAARFFGGGLSEIAATFAIGLGIGLLALLVGGRPNAGRLFEPLAALGAALGAVLWSAAVQPVAYEQVVLGALIVLIPGLTLTVSLAELASRHLVSGSARLAGAAIVFLTIGFGVALGQRLAHALLGALPAVEPTALPAWTEGAALVIAAVAFTVLFRARPQDAGWILLASCLALGGARLGTALLGPQIGAFLGAVLVGVGSNLFARLRNRPSAIPQMPGLILLVPGSIGFRGMASLLDQDTLTGVQAAFTMSLVAIALVTGLLVANVLMPPRRAL